MADTNAWKDKGCRVSWPATNVPGVGSLGAFSLDVPAGSSGRLDIYNVPVCPACPDGYWHCLDSNGTVRSFVEPGCMCWEKTLLAQIRISDTTVAEGDGMEGVQEPVLEFGYPTLKSYVQMEAI